MRLTLKLVLLTVAAATSQAQDAAAPVVKMITITTPARIRAASPCGTSGLVAALARDGAVYVWRISSG